MRRMLQICFYRLTIDLFCRLKVSKLVHAIKMGWIKPRRVQDDSKERYYDLWANEDSSILAKHRMHLPAPKLRLPGHEESYNPPPEYLFTEEEVRAKSKSHLRHIVSQ